MLFDALFGNPNIEKILLFLLVNEKCYAAQIRHCIGGALTPIQQALIRLEKGNILISELHGKTRIFRFNPHYPFLRELQALLKQGYHQLQLHEQHKYYCSRENRLPVLVKSTPSKKKPPQDILESFWKRLKGIKHLSFAAQSKQANLSGWNGTGKANVQSESPSPYSLIFYEQGIWTAENGKTFDFKNCYRWTLDPAKALISLEHLRRGPDKPVFLFELTPVTATEFQTVHPYLCRDDTYFATLTLKPKAIAFHWRILGPRKNEEIDYLYTSN